MKTAVLTVRPFVLVAVVALATLSGCKKGPALEEVKTFTRQIIDGVSTNVREIDQLVESHSTHWKVSRMASVDRNILRMAVFELLYCQDIPASVTINEAIEIAKKYGTEESGAFVNGILDHIAKALKKI